MKPARARHARLGGTRAGGAFDARLPAVGSHGCRELARVAGWAQGRMMTVSCICSCICSCSVTCGKRAWCAGSSREVCVHVPSGVADTAASRSGSASRTAASRSRSASRVDGTDGANPRTFNGHSSRESIAGRGSHICSSRFSRYRPARAPARSAAGGAWSIYLFINKENEYITERG